LTVVKNATKMGYPWVESILSVIDYVDHFHIGYGHSEDNTWEVIETMMHSDRFGPKISVSTFEWPTMDTGFAIGAATNDALAHIRKFGGKVLYVQADELWHPESVEEMVRLSGEDYDAYSVPYLHLEHNLQIVQEGAGYQRAIRMVANRPEIVAHRDAWTFEGYSKLLDIHSLPHPLVHCNYFLWDNVPVKKWVQATELYQDLGHYKMAAELAFGEWKKHDVPPEMFLERTSPFAEHLPECILPMLGKRRYYVREGLIQ